LVFSIGRKDKGGLKILLQYNNAYKILLVQESMVGRLDRYRVVMATPFEDFEAEVSRYPTYEKIAKMMEQKGLKTFVPHKDIGKDWPSDKVYSVVIGQIIPHADLVLADIGLRRDGIGSSAVGLMIQSASQCGILLAAFYEKGKRAKDVYPLAKEIEYKDESELLQKLDQLTETFH